jgi:hypothetical protein
MCCRVNTRGFGDNRGRMDAIRVLLRRKENGQDAGQGYARVGDADEHFSRGSKWFRHENGGGLALFGCGKVGGVLREGEFARPGRGWRATGR